MWFSVLLQEIVIIFSNYINEYKNNLFATYQSSVYAYNVRFNKKSIGMLQINCFCIHKHIFIFKNENIKNSLISNLQYSLVIFV